MLSLSCRRCGFLIYCLWWMFSCSVLVSAHTDWVSQNSGEVQGYTALEEGDSEKSDLPYWGLEGQFMCYISGRCTSLDGSNKSRRQSSKFQTIFEWKQLDFDYLSDKDREEDVKREIFIPGKLAPVDTDVYYGGASRMVFITIPRFQKGVPATLGTVVLSKSGKPLIRPYPTWKWHQNPEQCRNDRMVSVYRVKIDKCGRLWVLDTGRLVTGQVCPMQIMAFDLKRNKLVYRKNIPSAVLKQNSILVTLIVELLNDSCAQPFVYIADTVGYSIIVNDARKGTFWSVTDKTMYPYPNHSSFKIFGDKFDLVDGVLGMDLGPRTPPSGDRKLYYHALSSTTENWVSTASLRNQTLFGEYPWVHPDIFNVYKNSRDSQSAAMAIDKDGISYFGLLNKGSINCWNTATEYSEANMDVVEINTATLQFPSGVKVLDNPNEGQELWILTSRLQKVIAGSLQKSDVNFRILKVKVEDALVGTKCRNTQLRKDREFDDDRLVFY